MTSLDNLIVVGVQDEDESMYLNAGMPSEGMPRYHLNLWRTSNLTDPTIIAVPYRGGYPGGFADTTLLNNYLLAADGDGILAYDLDYPSGGYTEFFRVEGVSHLICKTADYLISVMSNLIQIRSLDEVTIALNQSAFSNDQLDVPFRGIQHEGAGDTALSMVPIGNYGNGFALLNDANDKTYLIDPRSGQAQKVGFSSKQEFPYTFQRREHFHLIPTEPSKYLVFTESTSDDKHSNRVYSFDIRGPPTIEELPPLELPDRQIISMLPSNKDRLSLLTNYNDLSHLEILDSTNRRILNSMPLSRRYDLGDRLQEVDGHMLIVRHLENEIVDVQTEESIKLTGAENDVPIPEISSTWEVPQYLFVAQWPNTKVQE